MLIKLEKVFGKWHFYYFTEMIYISAMKLNVNLRLSKYKKLK